MNWPTLSPRKNEVFGAELFAIHRVMRISLEQQGTGTAYTTTPAIERATTDRCRPRQTLAKAIIELKELLPVDPRPQRDRRK